MKKFIGRISFSNESKKEIEKRHLNDNGFYCLTVDEKTIDVYVIEESNKFSLEDVLLISCIVVSLSWILFIL